MYTIMSQKPNKDQCCYQTAVYCWFTFY